MELDERQPPSEKKVRGGILSTRSKQNIKQSITPNVHMNGKEEEQQIDAQGFSSLQSRKRSVMRNQNAEPEST